MPTLVINISAQTLCGEAGANGSTRMIRLWPKEHCGPAGAVNMGCDYQRMPPECGRVPRQRRGGQCYVKAPCSELAKKLPECLPPQKVLTEVETCAGGWLVSPVANLGFRMVDFGRSRGSRMLDGFENRLMTKKRPAESRSTPGRIFCHAKWWWLRTVSPLGNPVLLPVHHGPTLNSSRPHPHIRSHPIHRTPRLSRFNLLPMACRHVAVRATNPCPLAPS
jgi:hypothetical protein